MIHLTALCSFDHFGVYKKGDVLAVSPQTAAELVQAGLAAIQEPPAEPPPETPPPAEPPETPPPAEPPTQTPKEKADGKADTTGKGKATSAG